jgi:hypothetical protein
MRSGVAAAQCPSAPVPQCPSAPVPQSSALTAFAHALSQKLRALHRGGDHAEKVQPVSSPDSRHNKGLAGLTAKTVGGQDAGVQVQHLGRVSPNFVDSFFLS